MILDKNLLLLEAGAVSAAAGLATTTNIIDLGASPKNPGAGEDLILLITVTTTFTSGGSALVEFIAATNGSDPLAADGTDRIVGSSGLLPYAGLTAGVKIAIPLKKMAERNWTRYLGLLVRTTVATTTAGSITAEIMWGAVDSWTAHADATN